nr:hypothetical protein [uncultured Clostridium sp.]
MEYKMRKIKTRLGALCLALGFAASTMFSPVTAFAATGGNPETQLDGKLSTFHQGGANDCGAVSAIQALDNSKFGRKILGKMITDNNNGTYTLNFGGGRENVTENDVENAYIEGDLDARVIEAGLQKAMNVYNGCFACDVFTRMTGFRQRTYWSSNKTEIMNTLAAKCQSGEGITAACDFNIADPGKGIIGDGGHSYSIKSVKKDTVVVINPWGTSVLISMPRSQFEKSIRYMTYVDDAAKNVVVYWE